MEPLSEWAVQVYLEHLGVARFVEPNLDHLNALITAHLERVPFENLESLLGRKVTLDVEVVLNKVTRRGRGGYCYELNCLFGRLLQALGYFVQLRPVRFRLGMPDDLPTKTRLAHAALLVQLPDGDHRLVDVGVPYVGIERALSLKEGNTTPYRVRAVDVSGALDVSVPTESGGWNVLFIIEPLEFDWKDLVALNWYTSTYPDHYMRHQLFAGRRSENDGCWVQLVRNRFIRWSPKDGTLEKRLLQNEDDILELLQTVFNIRLSTEDDIEPLRVRLRELLGSWGQNGIGKKVVWPEC